MSYRPRYVADVDGIEAESDGYIPRLCTRPAPQRPDLGRADFDRWFRWRDDEGLPLPDPGHAGGCVCDLCYRLRWGHYPEPLPPIGQASPDFLGYPE